MASSEPRPARGLIAVPSPIGPDNPTPTLPNPDPAAPKLVVGWREWLSLPSLGIPAIKAKIDTGARSSALHTHDYELFEREGRPMVRFHLHPLRRSTLEYSCEAEVVDQRGVRDSGGHEEQRPFIATTARLGGFEWTIHLSLTNRESMKFRMLLGRQALAGCFVVDPVRSYLLGRKPRSTGAGEK